MLTCFYAGLQFLYAALFITGGNDFIMERFHKGDRKVGLETVRELIKYADSVAGDVQELCEAIWDTTAPKAVVSVEDIPRALDCVFSREGEAFGESVRQLTPLQTSVLRALADMNSVGIFSEEFMQRVQTTSTGALRTAIKRLVARRLIYQFGGAYRFSNPFFKAWLLKRM